MRVSSAMHGLLGLPGSSVTDLSFTDDGVIVTLRLRRRRRGRALRADRRQL